MISKYLNINCSTGCEKMLALTYLKAPEKLISIASRIDSKSKDAATKIAKEITLLDPEHARLLASQTMSLKLKIKGD